MRKRTVRLVILLAIIACWLATTAATCHKRINPGQLPTKPPKEELVY